MATTLYSEIYRKLFYAVLGLAGVIATGTIGYWFMEGGRYSFVDCLYMTFITVTTIGYGEMIDMSKNPGGRIFTMIVALSGIGILTFILTNMTAFIVAGEMSNTFRRKKMEKTIDKLREHYIICGVGGVGSHVLGELFVTKRPHVIIDNKKEKIEKIQEAFQDVLFIEGDATDSDILLAAGIKKAKGVFAITGDDNKNLVIGLTAKQLNPKIRVVSDCQDVKNMEKMKKAGAADAVVSPTFIGGLRMASEMVRSTVVSFLDTMLRDREKNLRVEEIMVPESSAGKPISALNLREYPNILLLAVKAGNDWIYNPPPDYTLQAGNALIIMTTPEDMNRLENIFRGQREI